ncbi:DUF6694 family lipoprotein [Algoriphagus sp. NG3]|uniref:DUF6694 family lipoprotein n=1 Tax=unclassified Algoriphagus TaxID=2641541 RepID=UPI002A81CBF1|nr:DUF6694 family lipoprotein [Algoriphagus sp. NG3]WPR76351.1 DUF6694 family lipoprotein [Algoriphagus sp. NG3]
MKNQIYFIVVGLLILSSCSKKLDASNEETLWSSARVIAESLSGKEKQEFIEAFENVGYHYLYEVETEEEMRRVFHKKTAKQIIKLAKEIEAEELEEKLASQPKIDASTINAFMKSQDLVESTLSWEENREFLEAVELVANTYGASESEKKLLNRFHNKTPAEIISDSKKIPGKKAQTDPKKKPWD